MEEEEDMEGAERARKKKGHVCAERGNINHEKKEEEDRKSNNIFPRAQAKEKRGKFNGVLSFKT